MNSPTREEEEQAPSSQPTTVLGPRRYTSILWYQADTFLQEIENFLWPLPKQAWMPTTARSPVKLGVVTCRTTTSSLTSSAS